MHSLKTVANTLIASNSWIYTIILSGIMFVLAFTGVADSQNNDDSLLNPEKQVGILPALVKDDIIRTEQFRSALEELNLGHKQVVPYFVKIRTHVDEVARAFNVERELLLAVIYMESRFRADARSNAGAIGLMQVLPSTARQLGLKAKDGKSVEELLLDPYTNLLIGTKFIAYLKRRFPDRSDLVLAAYHAGEGAVMRYGKQIPNYASTRFYVRKIEKLYSLLKTNTSEAETAPLT